MLDYASYQVVDVGNDGTILANLSEPDWGDWVRKNVADNPEWYSTHLMRSLNKTTGVGYFPRGVTFNSRNAPDRGATIIVNERYLADLNLLAHEYGHALGHGHTTAMVPDVMNPVSDMRLHDSLGLRQKFKDNFPSHYETFILPIEKRTDRLATTALFGALLWGIMG